MLLEHLDLLSRFPLVQCAALWLLYVQMHIFPHVDHHMSRRPPHLQNWFTYFCSVAKEAGGKNCFYFSIDQCL